MEAKEQGCEWADDAIENAENEIFGGVLHVLEVSLSEALLGAFSWSQSPQGLAYWRVIHNRLVSEEQTMSE